MPTGMSTEADMVLRALQIRWIQNAIACATRLERREVEAAVREILPAVGLYRPRKAR